MSVQPGPSCCFSVGEGIALMTILSNNWRSENVFQIQIRIICGVWESKAGKESLPYCFDCSNLNRNITVDDFLCRIFGFGIF